VLAVIAATQGASLIASVVLAMIYNYLMPGLAFRPGLSASLLVLVSYPLIATLAGMPAPQRLVDVGVLLFTNAIGAIVCYSRVAWSLSGHARRPLDIAARYGGEEFAMVLYDASRRHAEDMARQIQAGIESPTIA
jgi:hypothetical protein